MSGFTTPGGDRYPIFGDGGGQELADEVDLPLFGKVPITIRLREQLPMGVAGGVGRRAATHATGSPRPKIYGTCLRPGIQ